MIFRVKPYKYCPVGQIWGDDLTDVEPEDCNSNNDDEVITSQEDLERQNEEMISDYRAEMGRLIRKRQTYDLDENSKDIAISFLKQVRLRVLLDDPDPPADSFTASLLFPGHKVFRPNNTYYTNLAYGYCPKIVEKIDEWNTKNEPGYAFILSKKGKVIDDLDKELKNVDCIRNLDNVPELQHTPQYLKAFFHNYDTLSKEEKNGYEKYVGANHAYLKQWKMIGTLSDETEFEKLDNIFENLVTSTKDLRSLSQIAEKEEPSPREMFVAHINKLRNIRTPKNGDDKVRVKYLYKTLKEAGSSRFFDQLKAQAEFRLGRAEAGITMFEKILQQETPTTPESPDNHKSIIATLFLRSLVREIVLVERTIDKDFLNNKGVPANTLAVLGSYLDEENLKARLNTHEAIVASLMTDASDTSQKINSIIKYLKLGIEYKPKSGQQAGAVGYPVKKRTSLIPNAFEHRHIRDDHEDYF